MSNVFTQIAFTAAVCEVQARMGSRANYAPGDDILDHADPLGQEELEFIAKRDGFYQATVSETEWPYVQFRGGPIGFLIVLNRHTLAYVEFRGNRRYVSLGNLQGNDRVSLILMDYANRCRLKIMGRVGTIGADKDPGHIAELEMPHYTAHVERAIVINIEGCHRNCPQHITTRFFEAEIVVLIAPLRMEVARLRQELRHSCAENSPMRVMQQLGLGPLALRISGVRQLTPRVGAYELTPFDGNVFSPVRADAHIDIPVGLLNGTRSTRRYSISSNPQRRDACEIAMLREERGGGGSAAVHATFQLGAILHCGMPGNDFKLHDDNRSSILIACGIGVTPIKAMAQHLMARGREVMLHYAVRSRAEAAYIAVLERDCGKYLQVYATDQEQRLNVITLLAEASSDTLIYVCEPERLVDAVRTAADAAGVFPSRVRYERFSAAATNRVDRSVTVTLRRSGKRIVVPGGQSIPDAIQALGVDAPAGCRSGSCQSCAVKVLVGDPDHQDAVLSNIERERDGLMCICVSRSNTSGLTLDL